MEQDLSKLDVTQLHPLSPEVISRQATINIGKLSLPLLRTASVPITILRCLLLVFSVIINTFREHMFLFNTTLRCFASSGTIGHVAHGKSTVVKAISGVQVLNYFDCDLDIDVLYKCRKHLCNCS